MTDPAAPTQLVPDGHPLRDMYERHLATHRHEDAERYREGLRLTGRELPNYLLAHFDQHWSGKERWSSAQMVTAAFANDQPELLDEVEKHLRTQPAEACAERGLSMVTTTGPRWVQRAWDDTATDSTKELGFPREVPWQRGTPLAEWASMLVCRMAGQCVPLLVEQTEATR